MMGTLYGNVRLTIPKRGLSPKPDFVYIDEWNFRMHYRVTTVMLLICVALITFSEYFGSKIRCLPVTLKTHVVIQSKFLETYCFITPTFTVHPFNNTGGRASDKLVGGPQYIPGKNKAMHHGYYQWVPFVLVFNAFLFYCPHQLWKTVESSRLKHMLQKLHVMSLDSDPPARFKAINILGKYIWDSRNVEIEWSFTYVFCEYLNLVVIFLSAYLTDILLGRHFYSYGIDRIREFNSEDDEIDLIESPKKLFPTVAKCNFNDYGAGGSIQTLTTMCVLPMNVVNEKVFTFLWVWYIFLIATTVIFLIYRTVTLISFRARRSSIAKISFLLTTTKCTRVMEKMGLQGWVLLKLISLNLEPNIFQRVVLRIHDELMEHNGGETEDELL